MSSLCYPQRQSKNMRKMDFCRRLKDGVIKQFLYINDVVEEIKMIVMEQKPA